LELSPRAAGIAAPGTTVRAAAAHDKKLWLAMWRDFVRSGPEPCAPKAAEVAWRRIMDPANPMKCLVATDAGDTAIGFILYVTHPYGWSSRSVCYLQDLYVRPESRRRGCGRALIEALSDVGRRAGWLKIYWMTQEDNVPARRLYDTIAVRSPLVRYDLPLAPH
jgi:GNAT superfamily N-acetyltransferase